MRAQAAEWMRTRTRHCLIRCYKEGNNSKGCSRNLRFIMRFFVVFKNLITKKLIYLVLMINSGLTSIASLPGTCVCVCVCVCFSTCTCIYTIYVYVCDLVLPLRYGNENFVFFFLIWIISFFFVFLFLSFGGQFWFWNLLWCRYALDVNVERAEDVLTHKRLLRLAHDPANRPAIEIRLVQVTSIYWLVMFFILPMLLDTKLWRFDYE
jgi:hypothetical protein